MIDVIMTLLEIPIRNPHKKFWIFFSKMTLLDIPKMQRIEIVYQIPVTTLRNQIDFILFHLQLNSDSGGLHTALLIIIFNTLDDPVGTNTTRWLHKMIHFLLISKNYNKTPKILSIYVCGIQNKQSRQFFCLFLGLDNVFYEKSSHTTASFLMLLFYNES